MLVENDAVGRHAGRYGLSHGTLVAVLVDTHLPLPQTYTPAPCITPFSNWPSYLHQDRQCRLSSSRLYSEAQLQCTGNIIGRL
jgi:hypothetical protein